MVIIEPQPMVGLHWCKQLGKLGKHRNTDFNSLHGAIGRHLDLRWKACDDVDREMIEYRWALHLALRYAKDICLDDCWACERKNQIPKLIAGFFRNTSTFEKGVLGRTFQSQVSKMQEHQGLLGGLK